MELEQQVNLNVEGDNTQSNVVSEAETTETLADHLSPDSKVKSITDAENTEKQEQDNVKDDVELEVKEEQKIDYDFKVPEDYSIDDQTLSIYRAFATENNLSQEQAQNAMDFYIKTRESELVKTSEAWRKMSETDSEIGLTKLEESTRLASKALNHFGSDGLKKVLDETGFGNHPEIIKAFSKIGRAMGESSYHAKTKPTSNENMEAKDVLFGHYNK